MYRHISGASALCCDPTGLPDSPIFQADMQPVVAKSKSFRTLLEF
jgi:hypothetical protein